MAAKNHTTVVRLFYKVASWKERDLISCYYYDSSLTKSKTINLRLLEQGLWVLTITLTTGDYLFVFLENGTRTIIRQVVVDGIDVERRLKTIVSRVQEVKNRQGSRISGDF